MSYFRILFDYGTYHVFNRGHNKMVIFKDSQDKEVFLNLLRKAQILFGFQIFAYCLMFNHYHLLFKDTKKQLPFAIGWLQENYAIYFNAKYKTVVSKLKQSLNDDFPSQPTVNNERICKW